MCLYCIIYKYIIQYIGCYIKHYLQKIPRNQWFPSMFCSLQNSVLRNNYRELQITCTQNLLFFEKSTLKVAKMPILSAFFP